MTPATPVKPALRYAVWKGADSCGFWRSESERVGKNASFHPNSLAVCKKTIAHPNARFGGGAV